MQSRVKTPLARALGVSVAAMASLAAVAAISYAAGAASRGKPAVISGPDELVWEPYAPGATLQVAKLWGDRAKSGDYGMLLKMPSGFASGLHSHGVDSEAVLVQGTWIHTVDGGDAGPAKELGPGSYVFQPGRQEHNDVCKSKIDCIVFVHQRGKGDFIAARPARPDEAGASRGAQPFPLPSPSSPMRSLTSRE
jgi:Domain of unknown function (DUF4437)